MIAGRFRAVSPPAVPCPACRAARDVRRFVDSGGVACPGARIYELDEHGLAPCEYDDLDTVRLTRAFLDAPDRFIRAALGDD